MFEEVDTGWPDIFCYPDIVVRLCSEHEHIEEWETKYVKWRLVAPHFNEANAFRICNHDEKLVGNNEDNSKITNNSFFIDENNKD